MTICHDRNVLNDQIYMRLDIMYLYMLKNTYVCICVYSNILISRYGETNDSF